MMKIFLIAAGLLLAALPAAAAKPEGGPPGLVVAASHAQGKRFLVPEIDAMSGGAAIALVAAFGALVRERARR